VPFIECHITTGLTPERRERLIRDIIQVTHDSIGSDPKIITLSCTNILLKISVFPAASTERISGDQDRLMSLRN